MPSRPAARHTQQRLADGIGGRQLQESAGVGRQRLQPPPERVLERPRAGTAEARRQVGGAHVAWQLQQSERVASGLGNDPLTDVLVEPAGDHRRQQGARVLVVEPDQAQLRQACQLALLTRLPDREHDRDALGEQAACHESEHLGRDLVEPLEVVDETQQRLVLGHLGQEAERGQPDEEAVAGRARREAERNLQHVLLRQRECAQMREQRTAELVQARKRQLHLRLDAGDLDDSEAGGLAGREPQQCRLAHSRLAAEHQYATATLARRPDEPVQRPAFAGSATQRRRARGGDHAPQTYTARRLAADRLTQPPSRLQCHLRAPGAEGVGFEPTVRLHGLRFSRPVR